MNNNRQKIRERLTRRLAICVNCMKDDPDSCKILAGCCCKKNKLKRADAICPLGKWKISSSEGS